MILDFLRQTGYTMPTRLRIAGTVAAESTPAQKRIIILHRNSMEYEKGILSEADGTWEITGIANIYAGTPFMVVSLDDSGTYNAEVADLIVPVT